jgi:hypothetical protein
MTDFNVTLLFPIYNKYKEDKKRFSLNIIMSRNKHKNISGKPMHDIS